MSGNSGGRVAVVTGGARGIGAACAERFAREGWTAAVLDVDDALGRSVAEGIAARGGKAVYRHCDVADAAAVEDAAAWVERDLGPAGVLVTSAALIPNSESILDMDMEAHDRLWRVNYHGTLHACRSFGRPMAARRAGAIVTVCSINTMLPLPLPAYNPGKAALARLTQLLAVELGRVRVRVNAVAPTYVMTPALQARIDAGQRDLGRMMATHALDVLPVPEDVANAVAFLCSDQASAITGVMLPVDSGWGAAVSYKTYAGGVPWKDEAG